MFVADGDAEGFVERAFLVGAGRLDTACDVSKALSDLPDLLRVLEPATEETAELCDRMLGLGVIVQPTGDHLNILKIKPPLCIDPTAVDFFTHTLDRALTELGHHGTSERTP